MKTYNPNYYENGTPFSSWNEVKENIEDLTFRKNENKPCLILIDGMPGSGKTTFGVEIMNVINEIHGLQRINLNSQKEAEQIGTGAEQFLEKLRPCAEKKYPVILFDEAGEYNRRGWNTKLNKIMDRVLDTYRAYNIIIIMVLHDFQELPKHIWNIKLPTLFIHLKERDGTTGNTSWYDLENMYWIMHYKKTEVFPEKAFMMVHPVFRCHFKNLPQEESDKLKALSTEAKKEKLHRSEIEVLGYVTYKDIANQLNKSEIWVKQTIKRLGLKETKIYKKKKYFGIETMQRVIKEIKR